MWWFALWTVITAGGAVGMLASANSARFARRVASEMEALRRSAGAPPPPDARRAADLPSPVRRYLEAALNTRTTAIRTASLLHRGSFRPSLNGGWLPVEGRQLFTADPPGFIWWGRVRLAPGIWIDARDCSVRGEGNMLVTAESTMTIADARGPSSTRARWFGCWASWSGCRRRSSTNGTCDGRRLTITARRLRSASVDAA